MNRELFDIHEKYKKHSAARAYKVYCDGRDMYIYIGICSCGMLMSHGCAESVRDKHVPWRDLDMRPLESRHLTDPWLRPFLKCVDKHNLLAAYSMLPWYDVGKGNEYRESVDFLKKLEKEVFGYEIGRLNGYRTIQPAQ